MLALLDDEEFRIERLAGVDGRAVDSASPALEARRHIEQGFPSVLLNLRDAEGLGIFEILDWREPSARMQVAKKQIQRREKQMAQLGEGKTKQQPEHQDDVHDPEPAMVHRARA